RGGRGAAARARAGPRLRAPRGRAWPLPAAGPAVEPVNKVGEGSPHVAERIAAGDVALVVNTPTGSGARRDGAEIRMAAVRAGVPCITTAAAAEAAAEAILAMSAGRPAPVALPDLRAPAVGVPSRRRHSPPH